MPNPVAAVCAPGHFGAQSPCKVRHHHGQKNKNNNNISEKARKPFQFFLRPARGLAAGVPRGPCPGCSPRFRPLCADPSILSLASVPRFCPSVPSPLFCPPCSVPPVLSPVLSPRFCPLFFPPFCPRSAPRSVPQVRCFRGVAVAPSAARWRSGARREAARGLRGCAAGSPQPKPTVLTQNTHFYQKAALPLDPLRPPSPLLRTFRTRALRTRSSPPSCAAAERGPALPAPLLRFLGGHFYFSAHAQERAKVGSNLRASFKIIPGSASGADFSINAGPWRGFSRAKHAAGTWTRREKNSHKGEFPAWGANTEPPVFMWPGKLLRALTRAVIEDCISLI